MDHEIAVQTNATERYLLGEMNDQEREDFEAHYFSCGDCAEDVRAALTFAANAKAVFRQEDEAQRAPATVPAGFFGSHGIIWVSTGLNVLLLAGLGYYFTGVVPRMKQELAEAKAPQFVQQVVVRGLARSGGESRIIPARTRRLDLSFFQLDPLVQNIVYEVRDGTGVVLSNTLPAPPSEPSGEAYLSVSVEGLKAGEYTVTLHGVKGDSTTQIGECRFTLK